LSLRLVNHARGPFVLTIPPKIVAKAVQFGRRAAQFVVTRAIIGTTAVLQMMATALIIITTALIVIRTALPLVGLVEIGRTGFEMFGGRVETRRRPLVLRTRLVMTLGRLLITI
jgi:hypothetical protein